MIFYNLLNVFMEQITNTTVLMAMQHLIIKNKILNNKQLLLSISYLVFVRTILIINKLLDNVNLRQIVTKLKYRKIKMKNVSIFIKIVTNHNLMMEIIRESVLHFHLNNNVLIIHLNNTNFKLLIYVIILYLKQSINTIVITMRSIVFLIQNINQIKDVSLLATDHCKNF